METRHRNRWLVLALCALMIALGTVVWTAEAADTVEPETVDVDTGAVRVAVEMLDLLWVARQYSDAGSLVLSETAMAVVCNCNLQTGVGFCAQGQTCQACPCFSTQGAFLNAVCK